mmetsp:Transcript_16285/g.35844  ORF Transcript_16285/g.35844 Transcript_16285/m.35844 type:complete len:219 (+) Transcript_16285:63-719(+)
MNSLPHSKRSQYGGLKYSYPWAFQRLLYTLDNTPDLLSAPSQPSKPLEKLETPPRKLPSSSSQLLTGDQLMDLSPEALRKHFEGRVIRGLCNAHQVRRAGLRHISSAPEISRKQKKQKEQKAHGTHAERRPETAGQTDALTLSLTRDRNAGGRVFHKDSSWEKVGFLGQRTMLPYVEKPRSPLPEHIRREMAEEKETLHTISMRFSLPRQPGGMVFSS